MFDKKQIVWINPFNGFSLAVLKDLKTDVKAPNQSGSFEQNFDVFESIWGKLDFDLEPLFENIKSHRNNDEYCCLKCDFPFSPVCSELYMKFPGGYENRLN